MPRGWSNTTLFLVFAFITFSSLGCGDSDYQLETTEASTSSIINGPINETNTRVVSIRRADADRHWCTGTIVSYNAIITAKHCACDYWDETSDNTLQNWRFREAEYTRSVADMEYEGVTLKPSDFALRSECPNNPETGDDLMLIRTDPPIGLLYGLGEQQIRTLYNFAAYPEPIGTEVRVVGYGRTDPDLPSPGERREARLKVDDMFAVPRTFEASPLKPVKGGGATTCAGDSGAPVFIGSSAIYGIYSAGDRFCGAHGGAWSRATIIDEDHRDWYRNTTFRWVADREPISPL